MFNIILIICQSNNGDFIVIFQDLCSQRMDLKSWIKKAIFKVGRVCLCTGRVPITEGNFDIN